MRFFLQLWVLLFVATFCGGSFANTVESINKQLESDFQQLADNPLVPGLSVAVADKSGIIWADAYGFADLENKVALTTEHKLRIGSISKPMASAAMMRLVEKGKVDINVPIANSVVYWPKSHPPISLRQIASHTSGIRNYGAKKEFFFNRPYKTTIESVSIFKDDPLLFEPGSEFSYSTLSWALLTAVLESNDSSADFRTIMQREVFDPLKLQNTAFDDQYKLIDNRPRPYVVRGQKLTNARQTDHSYKWAGGGFVSTPSDVSRFAIAHLDNGYLKSETVQEMFTEASLNNGEKIRHGIGWIVNYEYFNERLAPHPELIEYMQTHTIVGHSGESMGGILLMLMCTDHEKAVTIAKNVSAGSNLQLEALTFKTLKAFDAQ
jgi:serine beta-lactamase-like protein LACTB